MVILKDASVVLDIFSFYETDQFAHMKVAGGELCSSGQMFRECDDSSKSKVFCYKVLRYWDGVGGK